jgi:hypothetical protein
MGAHCHTPASGPLHTHTHTSVAHTHTHKHTLYMLLSTDSAPSTARAPVWQRMQTWDAARHQKREAAAAASEAKRASECTFRPLLRGAAAPPAAPRGEPAAPRSEPAAPSAPRGTSTAPHTLAPTPSAADFLQRRSGHGGHVSPSHGAAAARHPAFSGVQLLHAAPAPPARLPSPESALRLPLALRCSREAWRAALGRAASAAGGSVLEEARLVAEIVDGGVWGVPSAAQAAVPAPPPPPPPPPGPPPPGAQRVALVASPGRGRFPAGAAPPPPPPLATFDLPYKAQLEALRREHGDQLAALGDALDAARASSGPAPQQLAALRELNALYVAADGERSRLLLSEAALQRSFAEASRAWGEERAWLREEGARAVAAARALGEDTAALRAALGGATRRGDALASVLAQREEELAALRARAEADVAAAVAAAAAAASAAGLISVASPGARRRGGPPPPPLLLRDVAEGAVLCGGGGEEGIAEALVGHADILEALALEVKRCKAELEDAREQLRGCAHAAQARDALQREVAELRGKLDSEGALHEAALQEHIERACPPPPPPTSLFAAACVD